ncbi:mycofactocin precursor MftA [Streptomyces sp. NPDC020801]
MHAVQDETRTDQKEAAAEGAVDDVTEDVLVEEVSIDGMCGVY